MNQNKIDQLSAVLKDNPLVVLDMVYEMIDEYNYLKRTIQNEATYITNDLSVVSRRASHDGTVNELGELQNRATKFDIYCSRYAVLHRQLKPIFALLKIGDDKND